MNTTKKLVKTINIEPTWLSIGEYAQQITQEKVTKEMIELIKPALKLADLIRTKQKEGKKKITLTLTDKQVFLEE